jgi:putative ABC transport system ATP-binding protein
VTAAAPRRSEETVASIHVQDVGPEPELGPRPEERTPEGPGPVEGAWSVLRRGLRESPELRAGLGFTVALALANAIGRLILPILIGFTLDRGILGPEGFRPGVVLSACAGAALIVVAVYVAGRAAYIRLVRASESALRNLRVRAFSHIHELSIAEQTKERRGAFVARVTADVDILGQFMEWGAISWITSAVLMAGAAVLMLVSSWSLAVLTLVVVAPMAFVMRALQRGMLLAYERVRTRIGETLSAVSESVMGAAVIRAYGLDASVEHGLRGAIARQYGATMRANRYQATIFPVGDLFGAIATAAVVAVGVTLGPDRGLTVGQLVAFLFLVATFVDPLSELSETFDMTQTAIAGWRKVLGVLDLPVELVEPAAGVSVPGGPLSVRANGVEFAYRDGGGRVLRGVDVEIPAGAHVAIVGETGCGKTTFAKLLCRLADPSAGRIALGEVDLREIARESRRRAVLMVPQDGFLFDTTIRQNVRFGRDDARDEDVEAAFTSLGLDEWVGGLPAGLDTDVGERGEGLSVGERQLVALARAQLASPGCLILDEATSAVDPETERIISEALGRLSRGRTTLSIAHRLSTAESADLVLVFDRGRIAERGTHDELVERGGVYAGLYRSWLGEVSEAAVTGPAATGR